jgi:hypothetical protein
MKTPSYLLFIAVLAGCATDDSDGGPIITQGGKSTTSTTLTPTTISSRLCVLTDLQDTTCSPDAGAGLTVSLGDSVTTSAADGTFTITVPPGLTNVNNPTFTVTGLRAVPTASPFTLPFAGTGTVPVVDADVFARALTSNGVALTPGTGTILATVRDRNGPVPGITATTRPVSAFGPFFDSATSTNWGVDGTGMRGVVLIPGLTAGPVDLSFDRILGGLETNVAGIAVRNGGVTILDTALQLTP